MGNGRKDIRVKVASIEFDLLSLLKLSTKEAVYTNIYGAYDIHPKYLTIKIIVETDEEKNRLKADELLWQQLQKILVDNKYPNYAIKDVHIGFAAQETIDREAGGNTYRYFK